MGYRFERDSANQVLRCSWEGQVTDERLLQAIPIARKLVDSHGYRKGIYDLTYATGFEVSSITVQMIADMPPVLGGADSILVIVAFKDLPFGMARMLSLLDEKKRPNLHVVRSMQEAYTLLGMTSPLFHPITE